MTAKLTLRCSERWEWRLQLRGKVAIDIVTIDHMDAIVMTAHNPTSLLTTLLLFVGTTRARESRINDVDNEGMREVAIEN